MNRTTFFGTQKPLGVSPAEQMLIERSFSFAQAAHTGQTRRSGESYFSHPLGIADVLWERFHDVSMTAAALLHDVIEDCHNVSRKKIYEEFGEEIGFMVDAVTKTCSDFYSQPSITYTDKIEKLLWAGMHDTRVFLLKLADREDNLKSLQALKDHKQIRMTFETHAIYTPLSELLHYNDTSLSSDEMGTKFWEQIPKQYKKEPLALKKNLISKAFEQFDHTLYDLIYSDSTSPLWSISDWDTYEQITKNEELSKNVQFLTVKGNKDSFQAFFQFKKGVFIPGTKFNVSGYRGKAC